MDGGGAPKGGIKISFVVLGVCILICLICYFYGSWADAQAEQAMVPKLAVDSLVKSVRQYQKQTGQFPNDLSELERSFAFEGGYRKITAGANERPIKRDGND